MYSFFESCNGRSFSLRERTPRRSSLLNLPREIEAVNSVVAFSIAKKGKAYLIDSSPQEAGEPQNV